MLPPDVGVSTGGLGKGGKLYKIAENATRGWGRVDRPPQKDPPKWGGCSILRRFSSHFEIPCQIPQNRHRIALARAIIYTAFPARSRHNRCQAGLARWQGPGPDPTDRDRMAGTGTDG